MVTRACGEFKVRGQLVSEWAERVLSGVDGRYDSEVRWTVSSQGQTGGQLLEAPVFPADMYFLLCVPAVSRADLRGIRTIGADILAGSGWSQFHA